MNELILRPNAQLIRKRWVVEDDRGRYVEEDVSGRAEEFLSDHVTLEPGVTLADLFRLMEASPVLKTIERRNFAAELCAEALKGPEPDLVAEYSPEGIEFLELYQVWQFDSSKSEYGAQTRWSFHGLGYELREDHRDGFKKGARIPWGISASVLRELLPLPLRVNPEIVVCESDLDSKNYGATIQTVRCEYITLGQVIHGVLWELSFHGGPADAAAFIDELTEQMAELDAGTAVLHSADDVFEEFDRPGVEKMFVTIGEVRPRDISRSLREIADDANAAHALAETFGESVQVRDEYLGLTGHAFRRAFRRAFRDSKSQLTSSPP